MAVTNLTTALTAIKTLYEESLNKGVRAVDIWGRFASVKPIQKGGNTYKANRVLQLERQTTFNMAATDATTAGGVAAKAITTNALIMKPGIVGDHVGWQKDVELETLLGVNDIREELTDQIARTRAYLCAKEFSLYGLHHRVDNDAAHEVSGTATSGSTVTACDTALDSSAYANEHFGTTAAAHGYASFTGKFGANYGMTALITNWTRTGGIATIAGSQTLQQAVDTTSIYHLTRGTTLAATDLLTIAAITRTRAMWQKLNGSRGMWPGNILYQIIDTEQEQDLFKDTTYQAIMTYSKPELLNNFEIIPILNTHLVVSDDCMYREADGGTESATGVVHNSPMFGKDAFQVSRWGQNGQDNFGVQVNLIADVDSGNRWGLQKWLSWHAFTALAVLDCNRIIVLMTGATALPITV